MHLCGYGCFSVLASSPNHPPVHPAVIRSWRKRVIGRDQRCFDGLVADPGEEDRLIPFCAPLPWLGGLIFTDQVNDKDGGILTWRLFPVIDHVTPVRVFPSWLLSMGNEGLGPWGLVE